MVKNISFKQVQEGGVNKDMNGKGQAHCTSEGREAKKQSEMLSSKRTNKTGTGTKMKAKLQ